MGEIWILLSSHATDRFMEPDSLFPKCAENRKFTIVRKMEFKNG